MQSLAFATISQLQHALNAKEISVEEMIHFYLHRIHQYDAHIGALLETFAYDSLPLEILASTILQGIPGINKDNICLQDRITSCASRMLANYKAPYSATACQRLATEGGIFIGRANMDEFAMGSSTETSAFAKTKNPWNINCVPGGSSGGSAAAVAAGFAPWALGSDTGGSVRQPAALCGIVGYKPTYGLVSRYGLIAYGSSLDQIGIFAHTAQDVATILSIIAGPDVHDSSTLQVEKKNYTHTIEQPLPAGLKVGIIDNALYAEGIDAEIVSTIEQAIQDLQKLGITTKRVTLPSLDYSAAAYFIISRAETASNLARFDGIRDGLRSKTATSIQDMYLEDRYQGFGAEVQKRILVGNYVLSAGHAGQFYENAKKVVQLIRHELTEAFRDVQLLLMPTHSVPAFKFGAYDNNKLQMDLQDYFTCPVNLAGIPAISLPCGLTKSGLPIGFQLLGNHLSDDIILQVSGAYQQITDWHTLHPSNFI